VASRGVALPAFCHEHGKLALRRVALRRDARRQGKGGHMSNDPLQDFSLRIPPHAIALAQRIAQTISTPVHDVTRSEVVRRAVVIGLDTLAKEYAIK
jgi:hypothetical protein